MLLKTNPRRLFRAELRCTDTWVMNLPEDTTGFD